MHSRLTELPLPPACKTGWPWTESGSRAIEVMPDGSKWPRISIITPSFNQDQYIEETIRSVILQGYPNLEFIIVDGGSIDKSVEIIRRYEPWLTYWVSEKDKGQSDAINKGFNLATGEWVAWLNSDDLFLPEALWSVGMVACRELATTIIAGDVVNFDSETNVDLATVHATGIELSSVVRYWERGCVWHQPGLFFPKATLDRIGYLDPALHYAMDHDLLCRLLTVCSVSYLQKPLARFRLHGQSKGVAQPAKTVMEKSNIARRYWHLTSYSRERNERDLRIWLFYVCGSMIKHAQWDDLRPILRYILRHQ